MSKEISKADIKWYKGHALPEILKVLDRCIKQEYSEFVKIDGLKSIKELNHEQFQDFKEIVKNFALNTLNLDLDKDNGVEVLGSQVTETIEIDCPDCEGNGSFEKRNCVNWSNECCGGCYVDVCCENCNGTGKIEVDKNAYEEYNEIIKQ